MITDKPIDGVPLILALATSNRYKIREISSMLADLPVKVVSNRDFPEFTPPPETGSSFAENAAIKAISFGDYTGYPCFADDSGLEVTALKGRPGILSARYAGIKVDFRANNDKLLRELNGLPPYRRSARFVCVIAFYDPKNRIRSAPLRRKNVAGKLVWLFRGYVEGVISREIRGERGFGYDPLFIWPPAGLTLAELRPETKNLVSHRAKALRAFIAFLREVEMA